MELNVFLILDIIVMKCKYTFVLKYIKQERQRIEVKRKSERDPKIVATNCKSLKKSFQSYYCN